MVTLADPAHGLLAGPGLAHASSPSPRIGTPADPAVLPGGHRYDLTVVEAITERPLALLRGAVVDSCSWVLNGIGQMTWTMSSHDAVLLDCLVQQSSITTSWDGLRSGELELLGREVQLRRDGALIWAGVPVQADVGLDGVVSFTAYDLGWYLTRRFFGAAERRDLLEGKGSMDVSGLPGWIRNSVTATRDTTTKVRGAGSARISGTGSIVASFTHDAHNLPGPLAVHLTVRHLIPSGTPTDGTRPIATIEVRHPTTGSVVSSSTLRVDDSTKLGGWDQATTYALIPPGPAHTVAVRLHARSGFGDWYFDDVRSLKNDTTGIPEGADLATHAVAAVNHFQRGRGKGTFGLRPFVFTNSGTVEPMGVRHSEHQQALDYLGTLTDRDDGIDWEIEPDTRRIVFGKRRGVDHDHLRFTRHTVNAGGWSHDAQHQASAVLILGEGSGPDRPEGSYVDTSKVGGLVLEEIIPTPAGTTLAALDPTAKARWDRMSDPQVTPGPLSISSDYFGTVNPGDRVYAEMTSGVLRAASRIRVQEVTLRPLTEQLEVA